MQVGELEKREVKASEELDGLRSEVGDGYTFSTYLIRALVQLLCHHRAGCFLEK